jgi:hypothetical protein
MLDSSQKWHTIHQLTEHVFYLLYLVNYVPSENVLYTCLTHNINRLMNIKCVCGYIFVEPLISTCDQIVFPLCIKKTMNKFIFIESRLAYLIINLHQHASTQYSWINNFGNLLYFCLLSKFISYLHLIIWSNINQFIINGIIAWCYKFQAGRYILSGVKWWDTE